MALRRRTGARTESSIWTGFVDAMSALLLVMVFVLSIFMIMQFSLQETITGQGRKLSSLENQIASISEALGASRQQTDELTIERDDARTRLAQLQFQFEAQSEEINQKNNQITDFENQLVSALAKNTSLSDENVLLLSLRDRLGAQNTELEAQLENLQQQNVILLSRTDEQQAQIASMAEGNQTFQAELEAAIQERDALRSENTRLANQNENVQNEAQEKLRIMGLEMNAETAKAAILQSLVDEFKSQSASDPQAVEASIAQVLALAQSANLDEEIAQSALGEALREEMETLNELEQQRMADNIAATYLRQKLQNAESELTAMTLALEVERKKAEETLTLLAAVDARQQEIQNSEMSQAEKDAALLALAREEIALRDQMNEEDAKSIALLNQQTAQLRGQLNALQSLLDAAATADAESQVQIESMGASLNAALARVAAEERKRANDLENYRSEFFGKLRDVLADVDGVEIVGDRFVFSSEVLFPVGGEQLGRDGKDQIAKIANLVNGLTDEIPPEINWVMRVDGHTDRQPLSAGAAFADNWELSQARALSVVRFMIEEAGVDPSRLAATGFGEYHPIDTGNTPEALARNRRIEFKLTEQ